MKQQLSIEEYFGRALEGVGSVASAKRWSFGGQHINTIEDVEIWKLWRMYLYMQMRLNAFGTIGDLLANVITGLLS